MDLRIAFFIFLFWVLNHLAYGWAFWGCFFVVALRVFLTPSTFRWPRLLLVGLSSAYLFLWHALFVPAFFLITIAWVSTFFKRKGPLSLRTRLALFGTSVIGVFFFLIAATGTAFGKRFYVLGHHALYIAYKPAKLIAAPGNGDAGDRYFYTVRLGGVVNVESCFTRASERPFDREEAKAMSAPHEDSFEDEIRSTGTIDCPPPFV